MLTDYERKAILELAYWLGPHPTGTDIPPLLTMREARALRQIARED